MKPRIVAGLDVGSATTFAVICEVAEGRGEGVSVVGLGRAKTHGVRGDVVTDLQGMTDSIRVAIREAEVMAGHEVSRVHVGIGGESVETQTSLGVVAVGREVSQADVERCHEVARAVVLPPDRQMLHVVPQEYRVDDRSGIARPLGMTGVRVECDAYVITSDAATADNLRRAVSLAGYDIDGLVLEPLAAARAVLTDDEREIGVAVVDVGHSTTSVAAFRAGRIEHVHVFPFGGAALTTDLVRGLSVSYSEAQRAKERHGTALARLVDPHETIDMPGPSPGQTRPVARELISHIAEQRFAEILGHVQAELENSVALDTLAAGVVLCGGTASMPGTFELAEETFACPVRIGVPSEGLGSLSDAVARPRFAVAVGLSLWGWDGIADGGSGGMGHLRSRITSWFRDFF